MELDEPSFLEDLLAIRRPEIWNSDDLFSSEQIPSMDFFPDAAALYPPFDCFNADAYCQMLAGSGMCTYYSAFTQDFPPEISPEMLCKAEAPSAEAEAPPPAADAPTVAPERKKKKVEGMPSKNLMAERRRRKRLNDRLSMLRSVVPKISKMDRTSILGDTIEYMKELLEKIKKLQEDAEAAGGVEQVNLLGLFKDLSPNEILVRNSPKFDVERRDGDTRIEICCASKPGLLLSTVSTLEAFGLDIQQCVISCFNDFGMQASCSENVEQRGIISSEDIKQALFRNAGYGGRCM